MPSWLISSVSIESSLLVALNSLTSHFDGQPRTNFHSAILLSIVVSSWMMLPPLRFLGPDLVHCSRHFSRPESLVNPCLKTSGPHFMPPTRLKVGSLAPPARRGTTSVS